MKGRMAELGFATRAIHSGYSPERHEDALVPPIHMSATFSFASAEEGEARFEEMSDGFVYSRTRNPTVELLEMRLADLEGAEACVATGSGMGAIASTLWTLLKPGEEIIIDLTLYGCTFELITSQLSRFGVQAREVDLGDLDRLKAAIQPSTKALFLETPTNPNMRVIDVAAVSKIAHEHGITVIVDNTYATPALQRPLALGADLVVHSATKYLNGHGDVVAGAALGAKAVIEEIRCRGLKDMTGATLAPMNAFLVLRGLKTLELRMERHCRTARAIAAFLEAHDAVEEIYFPGLASSPWHHVAESQMSDFGGMLSFRLAGGRSAAFAFLNGLQLISRAVSLGDAETLAQHPLSMTHKPYEELDVGHHQLDEGMVRISTGLETEADILADIEQALEPLRSANLQPFARRSAPSAA
jgi:methionine-gamma-lyase